MRPTPSTTISRPDLGALAFEMNAELSMQHFVADTMMPIFNTAEASGEYPIIPSEALMKSVDTKRAPRTNYARSDWEFETGNFNCVEKGFEDLIDAREARLYARYFDAEKVALKRALLIMLRAREIRIAAKLFNTNNFTNAAAGTAWNELAAADPRTDVNYAKDQIFNRTGLEANAVLLNKELFDYVISCSKFADHCKFTDPILVKDQEYQKTLLAKYFGVDRVVVAKGLKDTKKKGQTYVGTPVWTPSYALVGRIATDPNDLSEPCIGRTMLWTASTPDILTTETYREENKNSDVVRVRHDIDEVFMFQAAGQLITGTKA